MNEKYTKMLLNEVSNNKSTIGEIPLVINTTDTSYPFAFIESEEEDILGISYTADDGTERFVIVNKEYIVDIEVLYKQDIDALMFNESIKDENIMYQ